MEALNTNFTSWDWVIVAVYLLATVGLGFYANRYISNMADFVVAGRSLRSALGVSTMIGSELGLVTIMYAAQKGFTGGLAALHLAVAGGLTVLLIGLTGFIVVPLRRTGVMTIPEFYERRFSRGVRVLGGVILASAGILNMGMFLRAGALYITGVTGLHAELYLNIVMTALLLLVLSYTVLGGMVSVVLTDYVQFVVLSIGLLIACVVVVSQLGWESIVSSLIQVRGPGAVDPFVSPADGGYGLYHVSWMFFAIGVPAAVWPVVVMRVCAAQDEQVVRRLYIWSSVGFMFRWLVPILLGVCALSFFSQHPLAHGFFLGEGADSNASLLAMPVMLSQLLPAGLIGLITAGMLAAFMSTHDSYFLCWASVLTQDVVAPLAGRELSTRARLLLTRVFIVLIGLFLLIWGLWYPLGQDLFNYLAITGAIYFSGALAVLLGGLYWQRASVTGAYLALLTGFAALLGLKPVQDALDVSLREETIGIGTIVGSLAAMVLGSLLFPDSRSYPTKEH